MSETLLATPEKYVLPGVALSEQKLMVAKQRGRNARALHIVCADGIA